MVELIARNLTRYAGKVLKPGQRFEATEADARTLTLAPGKLAEAAPAKAAKPKANDYSTRALTAAE